VSRIVHPRAIKTHLKHHGFRIVTPSAPLVRHWWGRINIELWDGVLPRPHSIVIRHDRKAWAYTSFPEEGKYALEVDAYPLTKKRFLEVLTHNKAGSIRGAARELNCGFTTIHNALERVTKNAAIFGFSPKHNLTQPVAPGQILKGASQLYRRGEPEPLLTWVKSREDSEQREAILKGMIEALKEEIPRVKAKNPMEAYNVDADLLTVYTVTDYHVGMYAWGKETGEDWDLKIAEDTLLMAANFLMHASPPAKECVINQLGDFQHFDSLEAVTPTNNHRLDAGTRLPKIIKVATKLIRAMVDMALEKHDKVTLVLKEGNHDIVSSIWFRVLFGVFYENEPRVKVIDDETPFTAFTHGNTFLGFHHGHLVKNANLPLLFAARYREMWGQTVRGYIHVGHRHHVEEKEHPGVKVIQHPTIAAPDAYNTRSGYLSEREMTSMTYHNKFGQVMRNTVTPEMLGLSSRPDHEAGA